MLFDYKKISPPHRKYFHNYIPPLADRGLKRGKGRKLLMCNTIKIPIFKKKSKRKNFRIKHMPRPLERPEREKIVTSAPHKNKYNRTHPLPPLRLYGRA